MPERRQAGNSVESNREIPVWWIPLVRAQLRAPSSSVIDLL